MKPTDRYHSASTLRHPGLMTRAPNRCSRRSPRVHSKAPFDQRQGICRSGLAGRDDAPARLQHPATERVNRSWRIGFSSQASVDAAYPNGGRSCRHRQYSRSRLRNRGRTNELLSKSLCPRRRAPIACPDGRPGPVNLAPPRGFWTLAPRLREDRLRQGDDGPSPERSTQFVTGPKVPVVK